MQGPSGAALQLHIIHTNARHRSIRHRFKWSAQDGHAYANMSNFGMLQLPGHLDSFSTEPQATFPITYIAVCDWDAGAGMDHLPKCGISTRALKHHLICVHLVRPSSKRSRCCLSLPCALKAGCLASAETKIPVSAYLVNGIPALSMSCQNMPEIAGGIPKAVDLQQRPGLHHGYLPGLGVGCAPAAMPSFQIAAGKPINPPSLIHCHLSLFCCFIILCHLMVLCKLKHFNGYYMD